MSSELPMHLHPLSGRSPHQGLERVNRGVNQLVCPNGLPRQLAHASTLTASPDCYSLIGVFPDVELWRNASLIQGISIGFEGTFICVQIAALGS